MVIIFLLGCVNNFYLRSGQCVACPSNSISNSPSDTQCSCEPGTVRASSSNIHSPCSSKSSIVLDTFIH